MMQCELYFLRSSEAKIVTDMLKYAHQDNEKNRKLYTEFYGLKASDLGLYALYEGKIAGAIWSREVEGTATLSLALLDSFKNKGIARQMMEQFLLEVGELYDEIKVHSYNDKTKEFYMKFGFIDICDDMMLRKLDKKELIRPSDGYDPQRWMD